MQSPTGDVWLSPPERSRSPLSTSVLVPVCLNVNIRLNITQLRQFHQHNELYLTNVIPMNLTKFVLDDGGFEQNDVNTISKLTFCFLVI